MMEVQIMQDEDPEEAQLEQGDETMEFHRSCSSLNNSSQFSSHLLSDNDGEGSDPGFTPEYLFSTEHKSSDHSVLHTRQSDSCDSMESDALDIIDDKNPRQIITIIQKSVPSDSEEAEGCASKEMLNRFVIDAEGIHPSIDAIMDATKSDKHARNGNGSIEIGEASHQHVVIFSTATSEVQSQASRTDNQKLTIALVSSEGSNYPNILEAHQDSESAPSSVSQAGKTKETQIGLEMTFAVAAELEDHDGRIVMREITTQTEELLQKSNPRKRKIKRDPESRKKLHGNAAHIDHGLDDSKPFKCSKCNLKFTDQETCDVHIRCHVPMQKNYKCCFCDFSDTKWTKIHQHLFKHGVAKPHKCSQCTFSCRSKSDLNAHMTVHSDAKEFSCIKCCRLFKHRRNLVAHQRTCPGLDEHGQPQQVGLAEKHTCSVCNQKLSCKKNLEKHMEIHMNYKPYVCDKCGHATRLKESLIMHKRLHTGEKPFKCDFCDYATPDKSSLRRHKRVHTNDKPYKCQYCSYRCIQKHCLDTHIRRKHTGEQFVCGLCHYATHDRYGLNQHFKRHQNADGTIVHEIEVVDEEKGGEGLTILNPPTTSTTYIALPSGAVLKSTSNGKNTIIEDSEKKISENSVPIRLQMVAKLPEQVEDTGTSHATCENASGKEEVTVELGQLEASLLEQIQQPGDVIFVQPTGEIVIRRQDGHLLVIQRQEIEEEQTEGMGEISASEYLAAVPPSEISGTIVDPTKPCSE